MSAGNSAGWNAPETVLALVAGVLLGVAFVAWELRASTPMLPMRLFRSRAFSAGNASIFFINATLTGAIFFTAQYFQVAGGEGPLNAGLRLLPWGIAPFLVAPRAGALADRIGERPLIVAGSLLMATGMGLLGLVAGPGVRYAQMVAPMTIGGVGFALAVPAVTKSVVSLVAPHDIGRASGTFSTTRQLGGAFGVAVLGAVFAGAGGYGSAQEFTDGYGAAMGVSALVAIAAVLAGTTLPSGRRQTRVTAAEQTPSVTAEAR